MHSDVHHLLLDEFLQVNFEISGNGRVSVVAAGGFASFVNAEAMRALSPDEIAFCVGHLRGEAVRDGECTAPFPSGGSIARFVIKSVRSNGAVLGRVARVTRDVPDSHPQGGGANAIPGAFSIEGAVRNQIESALRAVNGNRVRAAQILGISRSSLYRKMSEYGLEWI